MSPSRSPRRTKVIAVAVAVLAVAALAAGGVAVALHAQDAAAPSSAAATSTSRAADTSAPVTQPAAETSASPTTSTTRAPLPNPDAVATDTVVPQTGLVITYASVEKSTGDVVIGAYMAGILEDGGTCAVAMTQGGRTLTAQSRAAADATTTDCGQLRIPAGSVSPGTWRANVSYSSPAGGKGVKARGVTMVDVA